MKLLVLGRSGQVARALAELGPEFGFETACVGRAEADLLTTDAGALIARHAPALMINAAAFTAVDRAESEVEAAFALNAEMPGRFAQAAAEAGVPFLHLSTDSVFDGEKGSAYVETDAPRPINAYGRSKLAGEAAVLDAPGPTAVIRTAWVYGPHGANFVPTMLKLARDRDEVSVVGDQYGSPTWVGDIARACLLVGKAGGRGIFHAAGGGGASRAELAQAVFEISAGLGGPSARVRPVPASTFPTAAPRQADTRLDCGKLEALHRLASAALARAAGADAVAVHLSPADQHSDRRDPLDPAVGRLPQLLAEDVRVDLLTAQLEGRGDLVA